MNIIDQLQHDTFDVSEGNDVERAYKRGWNAGIAHAVDKLRIQRGLRELAHAPCIRTIDWPMVDTRFDFGGESG